jgi:hypothetical protein
MLKNSLIYGLVVSLVIILAALMTGCFKSPAPSVTSTVSPAAPSAAAGPSRTPGLGRQTTSAPPSSSPAAATPAPVAPPASSPDTGPSSSISTSIPSPYSPGPSAPSGGTPLVLITEPYNVSPVPAGDVTISTMVSNFNLVDKIGQANVAGEGHIIYYLDVTPFTIPGKSALTAKGTYAESTDTSYTWHNVGAGYHFFSVELVNNDNSPLSPAIIASVYVTAY